MERSKKDEFLKTNGAKGLLAFIAIMLCSGCQEKSNNNGQIEVNTLVCQYMPGTRLLKDKNTIPAYAPEFTIDVLSGQEVRVEEDPLNGKNSAQRYIGNANRGAFSTTSSAITKSEFESVSTFFDPYNSKSVAVNVTRIYLKSMKGFTSQMRFRPSDNRGIIYNTEVQPQQIQCKWKHQKNKVMPISKYLISPLEGNTPDGGILMSNGWYEIDSKNRPNDFYEDQ